jgi:lysophospholipase L1-like esterase
MITPTQLARALAALLVFGVSLEVCARLDDRLTYGAPMWGVYNPDTLYVRDAIGKRGKPYARYRKFGLNALGYRGPDLVAGRITVMCFGASETFGQQEREGFEYPRQLERELNARAGADSYQVLNAALAGQSVHTATLRVAEIAAAARPVAALIYGVPANYIYPPALDAQPLPPGPIELPRVELRIADRLRTLLKSVLPGAVQTWLRSREIAAELGSKPVVARLPEENIQRYRDDLGRMIDALRKEGIAPVLVTHVDSFGDTLSGADRALLTSWRKFYPTLLEDGFLDMERRANAAVRGLGSEAGVPVIDLEAVLPTTPANFTDFAHFSEAGAAIVAKTLADGLVPVLGLPSANPPR